MESVQKINSVEVPGKLDRNCIAQLSQVFAASSNSTFFTRTHEQKAELDSQKSTIKSITTVFLVSFQKLKKSIKRIA